MAVQSPVLQKRRAKNVAGFNSNTWIENIPDILNTGLEAKFSQNPDLMEKLKNTGTSVIGEASPHDNLFGIGLSIHNPLALDNTKWTGKNLLGVGLMKVRDN